MTGKEHQQAKDKTIARLQNFLKESVNLEPELELFVRLLIIHLEESGNYWDFPIHITTVTPSKDKH